MLGCAPFLILVLFGAARSLGELNSPTSTINVDFICGGQLQLLWLDYCPEEVVVSYLSRFTYHMASLEVIYTLLLLAFLC